MNFLKDKNTSLQEIAAQAAKTYADGNPFPNIYFDDFFDEEMLSEVLEEFPDLSKKRSKKYDSPTEIKLAGKGQRFFGPKTKKFMDFLNSQEFLDFLQVLTSIEEPLVADTSFAGGGQHEIKPGGLLKIHADFNKHPKNGLDRRVNVLVYLNKDWDESYGGHFELWDTKMEKCEKKILPLFNRMAIFSTTDFSYHGHPDPLTCPEDRSRKSLALYYFSDGRPAHEVNQGLEQHSTIFVERKNNEVDKTAFEEKEEPANTPEAPKPSGLKGLFNKIFKK